jgi:RNA polymerase-associated protein CTR9
VWKKDYDRVEALAKGAYSSTSVQDIQAESLFFLARVHHVRGDMEHANQFYERACKLSPNLSPARFGLAQTLIAQDEYGQAAVNLKRVLGTSNTATDALAALGLLEVKGGKKTKEGLAHLRKAIDLEPLNPDLVLLEALALQQHESNYSKSLQRYKKAVQLMERKGQKISYEIYTNIGVLCHETKDFDESLNMYKQALDASDESSDDRTATLENVGLAGGSVRHPDNNMFFAYVDTSLQVEYSESQGETSTLTIAESTGKETSDLPVGTGDHIRVGESYESEVVGIEMSGDRLSLSLKTPFKIESEKDSETPIEKTLLPLFVKRENDRMKRPSTISIAFNLARLHEAAGRTLPAVELHKAILKRNPAYVNSYLRLACISIDCGALGECAGWLKIAAKTAPGNPEVLTLIGNLHLSLCDWAPAQQVFDGLLGKKVPNVEAYAMLSMANIYFANLDVAGKYEKYLKYSADYYKRILTKDTANAYAANGLGTLLAENAELFKAKEVFNRVREVSGDAIADAHLNLGHIYLAQKKHPEALQMYQSYLKRTEDGTAPISSKSRKDDKVNVLLYIAFAYFDWARQAELFNNQKAAPADERYKKAMENLEVAISENTSKTVVLTYNLCMTKLQAANCVLQKLTRNIRRTASDVEEALNGLQQSLTTVEEILEKKQDGSLKVLIATATLNDFLTHCRSNIDSAKSHLEDERKREEEANELKELQRLASESQRKQQELQEQLKQENETKKQEERDLKVGTIIPSTCCLNGGLLTLLLLTGS